MTLHMTRFSDGLIKIKKRIFDFVRCARQTVRNEIKKKMTNLITNLEEIKKKTKETNDEMFKATKKKILLFLNGMMVTGFLCSTKFDISGSFVIRISYV